MNYKIWLLYYDRWDEATTSLELSRYDIDHYVLCHTDAEKFNCIGKNATLIQTDEPKGIQNNFNWALQHTDFGDWAIFLSDDFTTAKRLENGRFVKCGLDWTMNELIKNIQMAEKLNIKLIGLNAVGNPFFVQKPFSSGGLVDGRCFAIKKTNFLFHKDISTIPDYYATCWHLDKYGKNLILNYTFVDFKRYGKKGLGTLDERLEAKRNDCAKMLQLFPSLVYVKDKNGQDVGSHIVIKQNKK